MDSSVSPKDERWFLRVCHYISTGFYKEFQFPSIASETKQRDDPESVILASSPLEVFHFLTINAAINDRPWYMKILHTCVSYRAYLVIRLSYDTLSLILFVLRPSCRPQDRANTDFIQVRPSIVRTPTLATNKMRQIPFTDLSKSALHVSGDKLAHPQEHFLTVHTDCT